MDPNLRAQTLRLIEVYKVKKVEVGGPYGQIWSDEVAPALMKAISEFIVAYDKDELSPTLQRKLIKMMKRLVARYPA